MALISVTTVLLSSYWFMRWNVPFITGKKNSRQRRESERLFDWSEVTQTRPLCALGPREHESRVCRWKTGRDQTRL